jgi:hypothetical protein
MVDHVARSIALLNVEINKRMTAGRIGYACSLRDFFQGVYLKQSRAGCSEGGLLRTILWTSASDARRSDGTNAQRGAHEERDGVRAFAPHAQNVPTQ